MKLFMETEFICIHFRGNGSFQHGDTVCNDHLYNQIDYL